MTPTQLIHRVAQKTPNVTTPTRKIINYTFDIKGETVERQHCWLCGGTLDGEGIHKNDAIKETFTDNDRARGSGADYVCMSCVWCLSFKQLRNYSIFATENELRHPSRVEMRDILLNPPMGAWLLCAAVSGQKHLCFKSKINYSNQKYSTLLEETLVIVEKSSFSRILSIVEWLYNAGFTKEEIVSCNFPSHKIIKCGLEEFELHSKEIYKCKGSRILSLCGFVAKKEDDENEG